jgi:predicted MFS family arabinose efflux permease
MSLAVCVGLTFGLPLGGWLAELDFAWLFRVDGVTALLAALLLWRLGERTDRAREIRDRLPMPARTIWRDRELLLVLLLLCATATVLFQFFGALPVFLKHDLGFSKSQVGAALAVNTALIAFLQMPVIHRFEHRDPLPWIGLGSLLICTGYGINALARGATLAVLSIVVWTAGEMLYFPLGAAYASNRAPSGAVGRYMSAYGLTAALPLLLAPLLGSEIYERFGPTALWIGCAVCGLVIASAFLWLHRRAHPKPPGSSGEFLP